MEPAASIPILCKYAICLGPPFVSWTPFGALFSCGALRVRLTDLRCGNVATHSFSVQWLVYLHPLSFYPCSLFIVRLQLRSDWNASRTIRFVVVWICSLLAVCGCRLCIDWECVGNVCANSSSNWLKFIPHARDAQLQMRVSSVLLFKCYEILFEPQSKSNRCVSLCVRWSKYSFQFMCEFETNREFVVQSVSRPMSVA